MTACEKCGNPHVFCGCLSTSEIAFAVALTLAGLAIAARPWIDLLRSF